MINTPRMRTITQLVAEYKAADPDSAVTEYFLRRLVAILDIPITKSGKKILINKDVLEAYLAISYFVPNISHPILIISGEKGSAKTTVAKILKKIIDPDFGDI